MVKKLLNCPNCGLSIANKFSFCPKCGTELLAQIGSVKSAKKVSIPKQDDNPFQLEIFWEREHYPANVDSLARGILSLECKNDIALQPIHTLNHLVMVLDISGSMNANDKYPLLREAVQMMMANLEDDIYMTVILFSSEAQLLCNALPAAIIKDNAQELIKLMDQAPIRFRNTNLSTGLDLAIDAVQHFRLRHNEAVSRIYILTDGELTDENESYSRTVNLENLNIEVNSYGFGSNFALETMRKVMGRCPGGMVKQIRNTSDITETFQHIVQVTSLIYASEVQMEIVPADNVILGDFFCHRPAPRIWRTADLSEGRTYRLGIGNIEAMRKYIWAIESRIPENSQPGFKLGDISLNFKQDGNSRQVSWPIQVPVSAAQGEGKMNDYVERIFSSLEDLRDNSQDTRISAYAARLEIAREEGRDSGYIESLEKVLLQLKQGEKMEGIDKDLLREADVNPITMTCH